MEKHKEPIGENCQNGILNCETSGTPKPNVPALRFPEFTGEWQHTLNKELFNSVSEKNKNKIITLILSASQTEGMIERDNIGIDIKFDEDSVKNYKIVRKGDYVIHLRSFQGGFAFSELTGICSPAYTILRPNKQLQYGFLRAYFMSKKFINSLRLVTYGIRDGKSISVEEWMQLYTNIPNDKEQDKIIKLFNVLDERIRLQNKIIEDLKKLKSAISKHLFARKDLLETTICLSNIATLKNGYAFQSSKYNVLGKWKILTITNVSGERYINDEDCNCIINLPNDIQDHQVLKEGDILISLTGNVGRVSLCKNGDYLLNQRVGLLQLAKNVNQEFLYQILSSQKFENSMIACGQGAAQMNIGKGDVESYVLPYSSNGNNILWVAKILHSYDECIINEMRKLTLLTMQKQYLLIQMFI